VVVVAVERRHDQWLAAPSREAGEAVARRQAETGEVVVKGQKGEQAIQAAGQGAPLDGSARAAPVDKAQLDKDFGAAMAARPEIPVKYLLYFESGGTRLTPEAQALIAKIVADAGARPAVDVSVIGHADTVGNEKSNEELSLKRAQFVADLLKSKGLKVHALSIESHGKRNLLVRTPDNTPETKNRRVEVSVR
jgi:outer membrane protein OmpA-like peptidoglycan-associated protein